MRHVIRLRLIHHHASTMKAPRITRIVAALALLAACYLTVDYIARAKGHGGGLNNEAKARQAIEQTMERMRQRDIDTGGLLK